MARNMTVASELLRLGLTDQDGEPIHKAPGDCPGCNGELSEGSGMVGEAVLYCANDDCDVQHAWEDSCAAIAIVL